MYHNAALYWFKSESKSLASKAAAALLGRTFRRNSNWHEIYSLGVKDLPAQIVPGEQELIQPIDALAVRATDPWQQTCSLAAGAILWRFRGVKGAPHGDGSGVWGNARSAPGTKLIYVVGKKACDRSPAGTSPCPCSPAGPSRYTGTGAPCKTH